jgi:hypothetical protein
VRSEPYFLLLTRLAARLDYPLRPRTPRAPTPVPKGLVPKRNYGFEKRQKELAKQQKRQEKAERRAERAAGRSEEPQVPPTDPPIPPQE